MISELSLNSRMTSVLTAAFGFSSMLGQSLSYFIYNRIGFLLLGNITTSCEGFRFLGITVIVVGWLSLLLILWTYVLNRNESRHLIIDMDVLCYVPIYFVMVILVIFTLTVSSRGGGKSPPGRSYKEYNLTSYSKWMQNKINDTHNWDTYYRTALIKNNVCSKFTKDYTLDTVDEFYNRELSPFESGCCMPPQECNFNYTNPSIWTKSDNQSYKNLDCYAWDNDLQTRCFNCQSCKGSFAQDLTTQWFWKGICLMILLALQPLMFMFFAWRGYVVDSERYEPDPPHYYGVIYNVS